MALKRARPPHSGGPAAPRRGRSDNGQHQHLALRAGAHGITVTADALAENVPLEEYGMVVLPGGLRGTQNLSQSALSQAGRAGLCPPGKMGGGHLRRARAFGRVGLLHGRRATCYPSAEGKCAGAVLTRGEVCTDGNLVTGRGLGAAIPFGLALVRHIAGQAESAPSKKPLCTCTECFPSPLKRGTWRCRAFVLYFSLFFPRAWPRSALPYEDGLPTRR